jgi:ribonuclease E
MASEFDHTDQQDSTDTGSTDTGAPEGGERVDPAPEQPAAPSIDPAAETDAAPAPRTRTRKTAAKTAKAATSKATTPRASRAAKAAAGAPDSDADPAISAATATTTKAAKATKSTRTTKKAAAKKAAAPAHEPAEGSTTLSDASDAPEASEAPVAAAAPVTETAPAKRARRRSARPAEEPTTDARSLIDEEALRFDRLESAAAVPPDEDDETDETDDQQVVTADAGASDDATDAAVTADGDEAAPGAYGPLFQAPTAPSRRRRRASAPSAAPDVSAQSPADQGPGDQPEAGSDPQTEPDDTSSETGEGGESTEAPRRRRRRGGKGRRGRSSGGGSAAESSEPTDDADASEATPADEGRDTDTGGRGTPAADSAEDDGGSSSSRRRTRRRRRSGGSDGEEDQPGVTTKVRESRRDEVTALKGSTRLEAKKQRRREGREAGRRRTIITEAEFLARRESVDRVMVVRHVGDRTQIGVLEDGVLVEHYISKETSVSMAGNIYLGRVQNVLPSMEAAFVDIGKGRNAVLYAGEVNWDAAGLEANQPKRIENALTSGESVLVQVTKDPIGHKGARLTSQISLPGRYLVYVPNSSMTGISRKLPETERARLKKILKEVVPDTAGVIVRTAAEGASEEELRADVERLTTTWADITEKAEAATGGGGKKKNKGGGAPLLLHGEPDLTVRVIRDIFNEDFAKLVVAGDQAWQEVSEYVTSVAPDLADRITKWTSEDDLFTQYRVDEQIAKAMDRKVWLPSGGSLVIDRTEAMTVVDVNTGKFIGSGGNLEETVTKNNIEAAEEIVRQLRLRDVGGIIVIDFIDMVLESNRDLVVRRLLECLGRDRTKHQVAEVTSLGLVQMTRKRVGSGLIEVFSETCEACGGRGIIVHSDPVDKSANGHDHADNGNSSNGGSGQTRGSNGRSRGRSRTPEPPAPQRHGGPTPAQIAAAAHAAAMKSSGYAGDGTPEDGLVTGEPGQDGPLDIVLELDLEETEHAPVAEDVAEDVTDDVTEPEAAEPTDATDVTDVTEPTEADDQADAVATAEPDRDDEPSAQDAAEPSAPEAPQVDVEPQAAPEPPQAHVAEDDTAYAAPVSSPPSRPRRHRGRVVAPAGPPRTVTAGGDANG